MKKLLLGLSALSVAMFAPISPMSRAGRGGAASSASTAATPANITEAARQVTEAEKAITEAMQKNGTTSALTPEAMWALIEKYKIARINCFKLEQERKNAASYMGIDFSKDENEMLKTDKEKVDKIDLEEFTTNLAAEIATRFEVKPQEVAKSAAEVSLKYRLLQHSAGLAARKVALDVVTAALGKFSGAAISFAAPDYASKVASEVDFSDKLVAAIVGFKDSLADKKEADKKEEEPLVTFIAEVLEIEARMEEFNKIKTNVTTAQYVEARDREKNLIKRCYLDSFNKLKAGLVLDTLTLVQRDLFALAKREASKYNVSVDASYLGALPDVAGNVVGSACDWAGDYVPETSKKALVDLTTIVARFGTETATGPALQDGVKQFVGMIGSAASGLMSSDGLPSLGFGSGSSYRGESSRAGGVSGVSSADVEKFKAHFEKAIKGDRVTCRIQGQRFSVPLEKAGCIREVLEGKFGNPGNVCLTIANKDLLFDADHQNLFNYLMRNKWNI